MEERPTTAASRLNLTPEDCSRLTGLYNGRLAEFGVDVRTVGWGSSADQALRFEVLCRGLDLRGKRVLDVGCGLGDFVPWAEARTDGAFDYTGLDLAGDLVAAATRRFPDPNRRFHVGTLDADQPMGRFDLVVISGALTFRTSDNLATMRAMLAAAFACTDGAVVANFMSGYADWQADKNFHYQPEEVFAYAKSLTPHVSLHHDYPLHEFTLQLFRQPTLKRQPRS